MDEPIAANGTIAHAFRKAADARGAVSRLRAAGFADVRLSERAGETRESHVPVEAGLTEDDFAETLARAGFASADATSLTRAAAAGGTIVTIVAGERADVALAVLRGEAVVAPNVGPIGVAARNSVAPPPVAPAPVTPTPVTPAGTANEAPPQRDLEPGDRVIPLRDERLDVATEPTMSEARVRRETVVEQKTITVPVRHDELVIERDDAETVRIPVTGDTANDPRV